MKKIGILFIAVMLLLILATVCPSSAMAAYDPRVFSDALDNLRASGKLSNDEITYAFVDLNFIENQGTVTAAVYESVYEEKTVNYYIDITTQTPESCYNKLTRFVFELTNRYRPETSLAIQIHYDDLTVSVWTYGQYKNQAMLAFVSGIPDCLNNEPYNPPDPVYDDDNGGNYDEGVWVDKYSPEEIGTEPVKSFQITTFAINKSNFTIAVTEDDKSDSAKDSKVIKMDVEPYIKNNRTYVPVRYLAYALGVSENGVSWDVQTQKVSIIKEDASITLTIGIKTMLVNKEIVLMDVPPEITNGRTMLPARWVAEALGAEVEWDEKTGEITIKQGL